jgi:hypothetical protein
LFLRISKTSSLECSITQDKKKKSTNRIIIRRLQSFGALGHFQGNCIPEITDESLRQVPIQATVSAACTNQTGTQNIHSSVAFSL